MSNNENINNIHYNNNDSIIIIMAGGLGSSKSFTCYK